MKTQNLKPFDLQAALRGEPVMLRNGRKAYVRHHETETFILGNFNLVGIRECRPSFLTWTPEGAYEEHRHDCDIVGMYQKTRIINGFEVPAPETIAPKIGCKYYIPSVSSKGFYSYSEWTGSEFDLCLLKRGLVFLSKEDAIANAKAMTGTNPYEESEE